jgi:hypothetical protein
MEDEARFGTIGRKNAAGNENIATPSVGAHEPLAPLKETES